MPMTNEEHEGIWEAIRNTNANWMPGHNSITDLEPEDRRRRLGYVPGPSELTLAEREAQATAQLMPIGAMTAGVLMPPPPPVSVDWRNYNGQNFVTSVKDQQDCGSCVAFGTAATMESRARIIKGIAMNAANGNSLPDLSEAHLFYCGNTFADPCANGWFPSQALAFATTTGVVPDTCFPYTPGNQPCVPCNGWPALVTKVGASHAITTVQDMKQWLSTDGPLVTCFTVY